MLPQLLRLWENLPARYALYTPLLIYTTDEHGFSLKTFYQKVATFEPTVLLLRTTDGAVFGAYCSVTWNARNESQEDGTRQRYFGTGQSQRHAGSEAGVGLDSRALVMRPSDVVSLTSSLVEIAEGYDRPTPGKQSEKILAGRNENGCFDSYSSTLNIN